MPKISCPECHDETFVFRGWVGVHRCRACGARLITPVDTDLELVHAIREGFGGQRRFGPRRTARTH